MGQHGAAWGNIYVQVQACVGMGTDGHVQGSPGRYHAVQGRAVQGCAVQYRATVTCSIPNHVAITLGTVHITSHHITLGTVHREAAV